jgi:hypothetical protein
MASRDYTKHTVSTTAPAGARLGDEYYNPTTNVLYKRLAVNGTAVSFLPLITADQNNNANVTGNLFASNVITTSGVFWANGVSALAGTYGNTQMLANLASSNPVTIGGNLLVSGNLSVTGGVFWANGVAYSGSSGSLSGTSVYTGTAIFSGNTSAEASKFTNMTESAYIVSAAPAATTNLYVSNGAFQYYNATTTTNWTLNVAWSAGTSFNTATAIGDTITIGLMVSNGSTAYYQTAMTIDSTSVTPKWQNATAPTSGDPSSIDIYTFTILKTAASTYIVLGTVVKFA